MRNIFSWIWILAAGTLSVLGAWDLQGQTATSGSVLNVAGDQANATTIVSTSHVAGQQDREGISGDWDLVWADEFNYTGLPDTSNWAYQVGGHGWGNHERQFYTEGRLENARVAGGVLTLEALHESWDTMEYTSVRLVTQGKHEWLYGRFEIRARVPYGTGTWPAIWMMPAERTYGSGGWPDNGEIDIMEHVGFDPGVVHASTHTRKYYWRINTQRTATIDVPDASQSFHDYILEWTPEVIRMYVDDSLYFTSENDHTGWEAWPFDKPFYLILNIAVGGDWGGQQGIDADIWPQRMDVDYVRVYTTE